MTGPNPNPDDEAQLDETLAQLDETRKQVQKDALAVANVEDAARQDRVRLERGGEELDRTHTDLSALRGKAGPYLRPVLSQIHAMASSANNSQQVGDIYRGFISQKNATALTTGVMSAGANAHYAGTSGYYTARQHYPSLDPNPPSSKYPPIYVEDMATTDQKDLNFLLLRLGADLYKKLQGARAALASNYADHTAQAYTSMQELLDQVLHHFSDDMIKGARSKDGRVKKAPYWKFDTTVRGGVTRPHRIRFVVQGFEAEVDAETERRIQDLVGQASTLTQIQVEKHRHGAGSEEQKILARRLLAALETFLLYLLRSHRPDLQQGRTPGETPDR